MNQTPDFSVFSRAAEDNLATIGHFEKASPFYSPAAEHSLPNCKAATVGFYKLETYEAFPLYTDPALLGGSFIEKKSTDMLNLVYANPAIEWVIFNYQSEDEKNPEKLLGREALSLLIGKTRRPGRPKNAGENFLKSFNRGDFHAANLAANILLSEGKWEQTASLYPQVLINLQLYQKAYDFVKNLPGGPLSSYYLSQVYRGVGEYEKARAQISLITEPAMTPKKNLEEAWIGLNLGNEEEAMTIFSSLSENPVAKNEALFGLGVCLFKTALKKNDKSLLSSSFEAMSKLAGTENPMSARAHFYLGNTYFALGNYSEAAQAYQKSIEFFPASASMLNLGNCLIKAGQFSRAAKTAMDLALVDLPSAKKIFEQFPESFLRETPPVNPDLRTGETAESRLPPSAATRVAQQQAGTEPRKSSELSGTRQAGASGEKTERGDGEKDAPPETQTASLDPSRPITPSPAAADSRIDVSSSIYGETFSEGPQGKDEFLSRAFTLASKMEDELEKKIYFNDDGLTEIEKRFRSLMLRYNLNSQEKIELVLESSSFLCFMLKEKHRGELLKFSDFDPWSWPMLFRNSDFTTYPIERFWRVLWSETLPEPGWIIKYAQYVRSRASAGQPAVQGREAVIKKVRSHPERIMDAKTEHKRMLVLCSTLDETRNIKIAQSGVLQIEKAIAETFKPQNPPTSEGWKILRCYAHIFTEIIAKEFNAAWFNTEGADGSWSMHTPWMTFIFPIGKIYKTAAAGESLSEYFAHLLKEKNLHT